MRAELLIDGAIPQGDTTRWKGRPKATLRSFSVRRNARAQCYSHPMFVALCVVSDCSFDYALEALAVGGGHSYTDMQQAVQTVRLVSRGLLTITLLSTRYSTVEGTIHQCPHRIY